MRERFDKQHGKCAQVMWISWCIFEIYNKFQIFSDKRLHSKILHFQNYGLRKRGQINSKKSTLRRPFDKQHGKRAERLLKSEWQPPYHIHWELPSQLSWKNSLLLTCQIFGLFVNTLAADEKYPLLKRNNLTIPIEMQLSQKHKTFSRFYTAFLKSRWTFEHFDKKKLMVMDFVISKLRTPKTYSEKCLKSHVWENPLTRNMVNVRKQCWNLHRSTFPIFIDHCQNNWLENVSLFAKQNLGTAC